VTSLCFSLLLSLSSCRKITNGVETGVYIGTFTVNYPDTSISGLTTIELKRKEFNCSGNINRVPAGGRGHYEIKKGKIIFNDENMWTADFDWNLILNGEYDYNSKGEKLKIWKTNSIATYTYELEIK